MKKFLRNRKKIHTALVSGNIFEVFVVIGINNAMMNISGKYSEKLGILLSYYLGVTK